MSPYLFGQNERQFALIFLLSTSHVKELCSSTVARSSPDRISHVERVSVRESSVCITEREDSLPLSQERFRESKERLSYVVRIYVRESLRQRRRLRQTLSCCSFCLSMLHGRTFLLRCEDADRISIIRLSCTHAHICACTHQHPIFTTLCCQDVLFSPISVPGEDCVKLDIVSTVEIRCTCTHMSACTHQRSAPWDPSDGIPLYYACARAHAHSYLCVERKSMCE